MRPYTDYTDILTRPSAHAPCDLECLLNTHRGYFHTFVATSMMVFNME